MAFHWSRVGRNSLFPQELIAKLNREPENGGRGGKKTVITVNHDVFKKYLENLILLGCIPSVTMREYLDSDEYFQTAMQALEGENGIWNSYPNWSPMQRATLAYEFLDKKELVSYLRDLSEDDSVTEEERTLFRMCAKDFESDVGNGVYDFSKGTQEYYDKHIYLKGGPIIPLQELLFYPVIFKPMDIVSSPKGDGVDYFVVLRCPDYDSMLFQDCSDESYLVLNLKGADSLLNEEECFQWHSHIEPSRLNMVLDSEIPGEFRDTVEKLRNSNFFNESCWNNPARNTISPGCHSREEMAERTRGALINSIGQDGLISKNAAKEYVERFSLGLGFLKDK